MCNFLFLKFNRILNRNYHHPNFSHTVLNPLYSDSKFVTSIIPTTWIGHTYVSLRSIYVCLLLTFIINMWTFMMKRCLFSSTYFEIHAVANILAIPHKSALYTVKHQKKLVDVCIEKSCFCKAHSLMLICHILKQVCK